MSGDVAVELGHPTPAGEPVAGPHAPPVIRVVRGNPTPAQVAALAAVLAAAGGGPGPEQSPRTLWTNRSRYARPRPAVGPGGWRASALPR